MNLLNFPLSVDWVSFVTAKKQEPSNNPSASLQSMIGHELNELEFAAKHIVANKTIFFIFYLY